MAGHYFETVENNVTGKPVSGATILVYSAGATKVGDAITAGTLATIYSDDGVTEIDQDDSPVASSSRGYFEFWTNETSVCYEISYDGEAKFAVTDVEIIGGSIGGDVTAIAVRVSALEALSDDYLENANNLSDVADASTSRSNLGLGTIATQAANNVTITGGSISGITDLAVADGGTGASSASAARTNLSAAARSQTTEQLSGFIAGPSNKSYTLALKMAHAGTITETTTISVSGTCTATFKVNSTALGGTANSVSSSETSQAHASTNTFAAGDDIVLTVSANSSCADMSFTIKYTRTLD
jgi:hypothetical protein